MNRKSIALLFVVLFSACAKKHEGASTGGGTPVKEGDGVQNGGGTYQFYASNNPLFIFESSPLRYNYFSYLYYLDLVQQNPYDDEHEKLWIENFQKYQRVGFEKLASIDKSRDWLTYADVHVPIIITPNLYDMKTGAPLMATNFTKPAQIYLAPHVWIDEARANIVPCLDDTYDLQACQEAQLATISVHEKLGALGFAEERSGKYQFSSLVYKHMLEDSLERIY